jgi:hypothetical protein
LFGHQVKSQRGCGFPQGLTDLDPPPPGAMADGLGLADPAVEKRSLI